MGSQFTSRLQNYSCKRTTHLFKDVLPIQALQAKQPLVHWWKWARNKIVRLKMKNLLQHSSQDISKAPDIWLFLWRLGEEFYILSYRPWRGEQANFSKHSPCLASTVQFPALNARTDKVKERAAPSKATVNAVVVVWPGISAQAKCSSRAGCEHGLVCLDLDSNLKPRQRRGIAEARRRREWAVNWTSVNGALPTGASRRCDDLHVCVRARFTVLYVCMTL